jgi:DNA primase
VRDLVARRVPLFDFAIRAVLAKHNLDTREGQFAAIDEAAPIIMRIKDQAKWKQYAVDLDKWIGFNDERYILDRVRRAAGATRGSRNAPARSAAAPAPAAAEAGGQRRADGGQRPAERPYDRNDPVVRVEREALKLAVQWPALTGPEFDTLGAAAFTVPVHAAVFGLIETCGGVGTAGRARDWAAALLETAPDDQVRAFVTELAAEPTRQMADEPDEKYADIQLARVGELAAGRKIGAIKARLQRMNPEEDQAAYGRMFGELVALEQRRKVLLERAAGG